MIQAFEIPGGIWATTSVSETPEITLISWAVFELPDGDRHFAGYNLTEGEGRASSKIVTFDKDTMRGVTSSGRVYQLDGPPGLEGDGAYVWGRWCRLNDVQEFKDVSQEVLA